MSRQHTAPILVSGGSAAALVPLSFGSGTEAVSEADIQALVHQFPGSLPISEIDPAFVGAVAICRELANRSVQQPPSAFLSGRVSKLEADRVRNGAAPWVAHLPAACSITDGSRPNDDKDAMFGKRKYPDASDPRRSKGLPVVHHGVIASANSLLKSSLRRDELRGTFKALAVEMEGSGVGDAAWFPDREYLIIRGVCDYCDHKKNDVWQGYAAAAAAAYLRALLEATPIRPLD